MKKYKIEMVEKSEKFLFGLNFDDNLKSKKSIFSCMAMNAEFTLGRFRVTSCLCVKTSLLVKPFIWKYVRLQVDFHANQTHSHVKEKIALGLGTWKFLPGLCFKVLKASLGVSSDLHIIIVFWLSGVEKSTWITCSHSSNKRLCKTSYKSKTR